ncbi:carboxypeptidase M32 [Pseudaeromonas sp. ZJS20]|uniref:carboxypeptidase M32 n=1 Tax=Pseudaeromonas aegiceratis TaxID=3153928 RepID=UPI00390C565E
MSYALLSRRFHQLHHFAHLSAICGWDQATMMPEGGNDARGAALAELSLLMHERLTAPELADWFAAAETENLDPAQRASLKEMQRRYRQASVLPGDLVQAKSLAGSRCEHAWRRQRQENDWSGFLANFQEVVALSREEAAIRAEATGGRPYDSLLDLYEPGMDCAQLDGLFAELQQWLPDLIRQVGERQATESVLQPQGPFATAAQQDLGRQIMGLLGFDFSRGRQDVSAHPFCGGVPSDVRITTRFDEADFTQSLMGIIHETGHARYEQGLPAQWQGLPVGEARSMGIHESQSLFFEMQLARDPAFIALLPPLLEASFGPQPAFAPANLARLYTRVAPGYIRVDADEVTYPAHIMLRYEIEKRLIEGDIQARDIPELWDLRMQQYLGLSTAGNYRDGCLQDIHWTDGSFGYFPSYTLGALYAAQQAEALQQQLGSFASLLSQPEGLGNLFAWLRQHIWQQASLLETDALIRQATGAPLSVAPFRRHLQTRYLERQA